MVSENVVFFNYQLTNLKLINNLNNQDFFTMNTSFFNLKHLLMLFL